MTRQIGAVEKSKSEMQSYFDAMRDGQRLTTRCRVHSCRKQFTGTAAEGRAWAKAHREEFHPELAAAGKRRLTKTQQRQFAIERSEWRRANRTQEVE